MREKAEKMFETIGQKRKNGCISTHSEKLHLPPFLTLGQKIDYLTYFWKLKYRCPQNTAPSHPRDDKEVNLRYKEFYLKKEM